MSSSPPLTSADRAVFARAADLLTVAEDPAFNHPSAWISREVVFPEDEALTFYQVEALDAVPAHLRASIRGPHGLGKTATAALLLLWFSNTREACIRHSACDWKVITTASVWRQLKRYLWPEVHKWSRRLAHLTYRPGVELLDMDIKLKRGQAFAVASDDPALIEGAHAVHILYIFDEAKAIPAAVFDAAEGAFSAAEIGDSEAFAFCMSTPGSPNGRFYDIQSRKPGYEDWWVRHVTLEEAITAGRISRSWADQRAKQWGLTSAVYQNRVLGNFATGEADGLIALDWIEAANERWAALTEAFNRPPPAEPASKGPFSQLGVDVARSGQDQSIFAPRWTTYLGALQRVRGQDTMEVSGRAARILKTHGRGAKACVDVIGIGAGVVDRLREQGYEVDAFNGASASTLTDLSGEVGFINRRAAGYWTLRELLDPANGFNIALPPDDELTGDLTAIHWSLTSAGNIKVESKDDIKKRLGRSPDAGDACVYAFAVPEEDETRLYSYEQPVVISPF